LGVPFPNKTENCGQGTVAAILGGWRERPILRGAEMFILVPTS